MKYSRRSNRQYHIQVGKGRGRTVCDTAGEIQNAVKRSRSILMIRVLVADNREYVTYTGTLDGSKR